MAIRLRSLQDADLDDLFHWESHPGATAMAAFTRPDTTDRAAFDAHYQRVRANQTNTLRAIEEDGQFVGTIGSFSVEDEGQRPLHAHITEHICRLDPT